MPHPASVLVTDAAVASRLHNRHAVGIPEGTALRLSVVEAAWCVAGQRLELPGKPSVAEVLARSPQDERAETRYLAYADLRDRGLVVRHEGDGFAVWPRGVGMQGEPQYRVIACADTDSVPAAELLQWARSGAVAAVVDSDGAVTHYTASLEHPEGNRRPGTLSPAGATVLDERVMLSDAGAATEWWGRERLGTRHQGALMLSRLEAQWLRGRGLLSIPDLSPHEPGSRERFTAALECFDALRAAGAVPRSGFKFGTDLRAYRDDPDESHAEWLITCAGAGALRWTDLARGVRVAHGVRKKFLVASGSPVEFAALTWMRP